MQVERMADTVHIYDKATRQTAATQIICLRYR